MTTAAERRKSLFGLTGPEDEFMMANGGSPRVWPEHKLKGSELEPQHKTAN